mmetsp:Transcript_8416/g.25282  ORF Transcript_8416/g.25282 Transcript_8416/m.25282 type:complete len:775 (+) Transcript_8416:50-2374(+)
MVPSRKPFLFVTAAGAGCDTRKFWSNELCSVRPHPAAVRLRCAARPAEEPDTGSEGCRVLKEGELVVHEKYGVGRFLGVQMSSEMSGAVKEFAVLDYLDGDLLVPVTQLDRLSKVTKDIGHVQLDRLTSVYAFQENAQQRKVRARRVRREREKIRKRILDLHGVYAARNTMRRPPHKGACAATEEQFSSSFPYALTRGQKKSLREITRDLCESDRPMDRLLCGDVGFGKTEVAFRAAMRIILCGKQVVLLCPTTILATQHFKHAIERFASVSKSIKIGRLSRYVPKDEQEETMRGLADGSVDFVIGTHAVLRDKIQYRNLGLLIIDEEHRFGVCQKEFIREQHTHVDLLSLSATPIPRTLHLAMNGLRDVSVITTPPANRVPIRTLIAPRGNGTIRKAIGKELARGGQVYYVVRHITGIEATARWIKSIFPEARVLIAHGQMRSLERRVNRFAAGRADILVSTTIIENGIDMPHVNTILIDEASCLGLAQLHQLRGRVGRSQEQAYAWLLYSGPAAAVSDRLKILERHSELGSGFEVAKKDLELRGMGTVLGIEQSGRANAIEPEDYARILAEEITLAKQHTLEVLPPLPEVQTTEIFLPVDSHIPRDYITDDELRLEAYFQLNSANSVAQLEQCSSRLKRVWGSPMPMLMGQFLFLLEVKLLAKSLGISRIYVEKQHVMLEWAIAARTVKFLASFLQNKRDMARFDPSEDNGIVTLRGLGICAGDVQVAKLCCWFQVFEKCVSSMRRAQVTSVLPDVESTAIQNDFAQSEQSA